MLSQMTARLLGQNTLAGGLRTILNDVIALHGAEFGNIQLAIDDDTLALIEHRGFDEPSLRSLRRVASDGGAASARAFAARKSVVIFPICPRIGLWRRIISLRTRWEFAPCSRRRSSPRAASAWACLDPLRERAHAD
jgi:hypothetical protein